MNLWQRVLERIERRVSKQSFQTWFSPTRLVRDESGVLTVSVPNTLFLEWIGSNFQGVVDEAVAEISSEVQSVSFVTAPSPAEKGSSKRGKSALPRAAAGSSGLARLNPSYTFDSFVVSSCNQFAHAAARSVAETPSQRHNPLYIYGGVGLGKTHLLHAIGNHLAATRPSAVLRYLTSEQFMNDLINCIRFEKTLEFKDRYRTVDVLLLDDVQFLQGKERTQEEFFHTFNQLHELQKQIVLISDCPPREIPALEERLRSRFEWGLIADIHPPDLETKVAILRKKAAAEACDLPPEVAMHIANRVKASSNVRELEGCLNRVLAYSSLTGRPLSIEMAEEALKGLLDAGMKVITIESIQRSVAEAYQVRVADLRGRNNAREVSLPRHVAMYIAKELTRSSLPEIGRRFGGKHHTTVLHALRKIERRRDNDPSFDRQLGGLLKSFQ